jgi:hypothetical protein
MISTYIIGFSCGTNGSHLANLKEKDFKPPYFYDKF